MNHNTTALQYSTLIVDEHNPTRETISRFLTKYFPHFKIALKTHSPRQAEDFVTENRPSLIFYDISLPGSSFLEFIEDRYTTPPVVIFLGFREGITSSVLKVSTNSFLLKPVWEDEFKKTMARVQARLNLIHNQENHSPVRTVFRKIESYVKLQKIVVPVRNGIAIISLGDIKYIQSDNSYSILYMEDESFVVCRSIMAFEDMLKGLHFFRIHNSFLLNLHYLQSFTNTDGGTVLLRDGTLLPVAKRRLLQLKEVLSLFFHKI